MKENIKIKVWKSYKERYFALAEFFQENFYYCPKCNNIVIDGYCCTTCNYGEGRRR